MTSVSSSSAFALAEADALAEVAALAEALADVSAALAEALADVSAALADAAALAEESEAAELAALDAAVPPAAQAESTKAIKPTNTAKRNFFFMALFSLLIAITDNYT